MATIPPDGETSRLLPLDGEGSGTIGDMSPTHNPRHKRHVDWTTVFVAVAVVAVAGIMVAYGAAGSYESLSQLAARHGVPFPRFFPIGVDGALVGFLVLDIALTLRGMPAGALHWVVRLFGAVSVVFNFRAGWPDTLGAGARVMAPALLVILSEVLRHVILREQRRGASIPWKRWFLDTTGTWRMWRRMQLWDIHDYADAIDMELSRLRAIEQLRGRFGEKWETRVPADLAWMLGEGVRMGDALAMVGELCAPSQALTPPLASAPGRRSAPARKSASRKRRAGASAETIDSQAQALAEYMANPGINGREMADALGLSPSRGRALLAMVKQSGPVTGPIPRVPAD